ncbi:MAG TPA: DNA methyltransferase [Bacteriovoracaceae bacterium]|nr:DNA methyltransferase [Bacteriovoracaceae bacterium]
MNVTHNTWLNLIDRSGPFLSVQVLESALPQGLDIIHTKFKQKLRRAYELWQEDIDSGELQEAFHYGWVDLVLKDILEYDEKSLFLNNEIKYFNEELRSEYSPKYIVKSPVSNKIRFFIDVLPPDVDFEKSLEGDKWPASLVEKMTLLCRSEKVRYGLLTNGEKWTLVTAPIGSTSGIATWYSRLWRYEPVTLKAFQTLLGARRCFGPESETLDTLLDNSLNSYEEITNTLGEQVRRAVEVLIQSLDSADQDRNRELLKDVSTSELYDASVTVMMRLVFLLCAEERGLLLLGDPTYDQFYAVTTLRAQLAEEAGRLGPEVLERRHDAWSRLLANFRAVYGGIEHEALRLPPLGGSLFDPDKYPFLEGRKVGSSWKNSESAPLPIDNRTVLLLLTALQILEQKGGALYLSYRALDIEQIGHVYEGLLDNTVMRVAETTLALKGKKDEKIFISFVELKSKKNKGRIDLISFLSDKLEKSAAAIDKQIEIKITEDEFGKLLLACGGSEELAADASSFYHLIGTDIWGYPLVYRAGSYAVSSGSNRKDSGTHYTPRSLTEKIVKRALEPLVYDGPGNGLDKKDWKLKSSKEIISLKICDPAMGSAAFLVQACRSLSEYLVQAWNNEGSTISADQHDRLLYARKLVTERCLYGVDLNPLAVELAKLSLWLITMSKGKPFEFLDHNFKSGDSLLGIKNRNELYSFSIREEQTESQIDFLSVYAITIMGEALSLREQASAIVINDINDIDLVTSLNNKSQNLLNTLKIIADSICASSDNPSKEIIFREYIEKIMSGKTDQTERLSSLVKDELLFDTGNARFYKKPFHWLLEFPEVFLKSNGFDLVIGNPPFLGGRKIRSAYSLRYLNFLTKIIFPNSSANADLCSFFLLRVNSLLKQGGVSAQILQSSISEGDTRETGLAKLVNNQNSIVCAYPKSSWPGNASVVISILVMFKGKWNGKKYLNDEMKDEINSYLTAESSNTTPLKLPQNQKISFQGTIALGKGFVIEEEIALRLLSKDSKNQDVIYRYLVGQELNIDPLHTPSKWIINFHDWPLTRENEYKGPVAEDYSDCLSIIREKVYPERTRKNENGEFALRKPLPQKWWQYGDKRPELYRRLKELKFVFAIATGAAKYVAFGRVSGRTVYSHSISILATDDYAIAGVVSSNLHEVWSRKYGSYNLELIRYAPTDLLDTFPFPVLIDELRDCSKKYFDHREQFNLGITEIYNKVHDRSNQDHHVVLFRQVITELDYVLLKAYGWSNLHLNHDFYETEKGVRFTISNEARTIVSSKLIELNYSLGAKKEEKSLAKPKSKKSKDQQETNLEERE